MKKIYSMAGKNYEVHIFRDGQYFINCSIYKVVHPKWKFFRTKYVSSKTFFIEDYLTIDVGIKIMISKVLQEESEEKKEITNGKNFQKAIDKLPILYYNR